MLLLMDILLLLAIVFKSVSIAVRDESEFRAYGTICDGASAFIIINYRDFAVCLG
jgi:hypothetical protein